MMSSLELLVELWQSDCSLCYYRSIFVLRYYVLGRHVEGRQIYQYVWVLSGI